MAIVWRSMCGIAGILRTKPGENPETLETHLRSLARGLAHRGPDAQGFFVEGPIGLAHTRLAIIDLTPTGAQPMHTQDRRFTLVFNGEIYNFLELRRELEEAGESFVGRSDTEVVLRLLARMGAEGLSRLDGMFAVALLDRQAGRVLLARDRIGQKPLYVAELTGGEYAFASEVTPLLRLDGVDRSLSREALSHLLTFGVVPAPWTLRSGIRQLLPGTWESLRAGDAPRQGSFVAPPGPVGPVLHGDIEHLSVELEGVLSRAVRDHLVADVPVGMLLSGGVDSSVVGALAARHVGRLKTYAVVHRDPRYDESAAARAVAAAIGSEHHEIELPGEGLSWEDLDVLVDHHGDPFADSSSLNVLRIAREMRRNVTVALSGDGGDEVFAGYPRFTQLGRIGALGILPRPMLQAASALAALAPGMRARQVARVLRIASMSRARRAIAFTSFFWPEEQDQALRPEWRLGDADATLEALLEARGITSAPDPVAAAHWMEQRLILPDDMLTKVDRMSMAMSLEVRPPLIGGTVLDFAARLPFRAKHGGGEGKRVLRALARRLVPAWVVDRPKQGFALPLAQHGGRVLEEASRFSLESEDSPLRGLFHGEALARFAVELQGEEEGRDPEDSPFRRVHRRWLLALLAYELARHGPGFEV